MRVWLGCVAAVLLGAAGVSQQGVAAGARAATAGDGEAFPAYKIFAGKPRFVDSATPARLCLNGAGHPCFRLPAVGKGDDAIVYFWHPKALRVTAPSGASLVLFDAGFVGGSGDSFEYALLQMKRGKMVDLLPRITLSNQSDHALWNLPEMSPLPLFVTADFLWDDGARYSPHRFTVWVYRYDAAAERYTQVLKYNTQRRYPSFDINAAPYPLLEQERKTVMAKLASNGR